MSLFQKKKVLVLFGSPQGHGHTRGLLDAFLEAFSENREWQVQELNLYEESFHPCVGCGACAKQEGCVFSDMDGFDRAFRQCDLLVVASPVYNFSFPAPVKAWLDRTQRYFEARFSLGLNPPVKKHRQAVLLLTMGSQDDYAVEVCTHQLERAFSVMNTTLTGCALWDATDLGDQHKGQAQEQARAIALEILERM